MSLKRNPSRNVVNFAAGPSALPYEVLETAQRELIDYQNTGVSVMGINFLLFMLLESILV